MIVNRFGKYFEGAEEADLSKPRVILLERKTARHRAQAAGPSKKNTRRFERRCRNRGRRKPARRSAKKHPSWRAFQRRQELRAPLRQTGRMPSELVEDLLLAGYLHNAGKAHPEFKRMLYGGDEIAVMSDPTSPRAPSWPTCRTSARLEEARIPGIFRKERAMRSHRYDLQERISLSASPTIPI